LVFLTRALIDILLQTQCTGIFENIITQTGLLVCRKTDWRKATAEVIRFIVYNLLFISPEPLFKRSVNSELAG
jgi:hypothetical protein